MMKLRHILASAVFLPLAVLIPAQAQSQPVLEIEVEALTPDGQLDYDFTTGVATGTNGVFVKYGEAVLTAERATVNQETGETVADGRVRIQQDEQIWVGEHIRYNFKTHQMEAGQFRTGKPPVFAAGESLQGNTSNRVYTARNAYVTTDDVAGPAEKVRAKSLAIIPGKLFQARNATLYVDGVPLFYFPYYSRNLGERANNFTFLPGYQSRFGPFLLGRTPGS